MSSRCTGSWLILWARLSVVSLVSEHEAKFVMAIHLADLVQMSMHVPRDHVYLHKVTIFEDG